MTPPRPRIGSVVLVACTGVCATCCDESGGGGGAGVRIIVTNQGSDDRLGVECSVSFEPPLFDTVAGMSPEVELAG